MTLDASTRNRLQKTVTACRRLLTADFNLQLQQDYGIYADEGKVFPLEKLVSQDDRTLQIARLLRDRIDHVKASEPEARELLKHAVDRVLREQAFTVLNRFAVLRMAEERGLIQLSVGKGFQSDAFLVFDNFVGAALGSQYDRYRLFFSCLVDELSLDLGVLFDRHSPFGLLFPSAEAVGRLFDELNAPDIQPLWKADETIGWVYQYYNDEIERRKMREESAAPRSSRELAVRNQFFTPRYVVEFLTDNTLGRMWYEMRKGETSLNDQCRYLVRQPNEVFLGEGRNRPDEKPTRETEKEELAQEELLKQSAYVPHRPLKDPREIRILDPACGSMHFGLYAFDLLEVIYREAWDIPDLRQRLAEAYGHAELGEVIAVPESVRLRNQGTVRCFASGREVRVEEAVFALAPYAEGHIAGRPLIYHPEEVASRRTTLGLEIPLRAFRYDRAVQDNWFSPTTGRLFLETAGCFDFQNQPAKTLEEASEAFQRDVPRLIIERNLHGIDIDPRCAQIAGSSLWLRAQKSWQEMKLRSFDRPIVRKSNIVCAEPMPGEKDLLREFVEQQFPLEERPIFTFLLETVFRRMSLAGEAGSLLCIEAEIRIAIAQAKKLWKEGPKHEQVALFVEAGTKPSQSEMLLDLSGISDEQFWERAEQQIYKALEAYSEQAEHSGGFQRRLFADDAAHGFAFIDLCRKSYDVVVMNPPFGEAALSTRDYIAINFPESKDDLYAAFVSRGTKMLANGFLGVISNRTGFFLTGMRRWREATLLASPSLALLADLGDGVLDGALVEAAAYTIQKSSAPCTFFRLLDQADKASSLLESIARVSAGEISRGVFVNQVASFQSFPESRVSYWAPLSVRDIYRTLKGASGSGLEVKFGLSTKDDWRFLRLCWEISETKIVSSQDEATSEKPWMWLAKGGEYSPHFSDIHLVANWAFRGKEIAARVVQLYPYLNGDANWVLHTEVPYGRPGITYTKRTTSGFSPRVLPAGCLISDKGCTIFADDNEKLARVLTTYGSRSFGYLLEFNVASGDSVHSGSAARDYEIGTVASVPIPPVTALSEKAAADSVAIWKCKAVANSRDETSRYFLVPCPQRPTLREIATAIRAQNLADFVKILEQASDAELAVKQLYGFDSAASDACDAEFGPDVTSYPPALSDGFRTLVPKLWSISMSALVAESSKALGFARFISKMTFLADRRLELICHRLQVHPRTVASLLGELPASDDETVTVAQGLLSYALGCVFGRWDIRLATGDRKAPELPKPFDPLPVCSPGMLQNDAGLSANPADISADYPLRISRPGILVDDENHLEDIAARVREAIEVIWKDRAETVEQETCEILGVNTLRDYFRRPTAFFANHLKGYSKSRRQAPIYWPLSTVSGTYTLWLYYPCLDEQTLFQCVNRFIDPKLAALEKDMARLRGESGDKATGTAMEKADNLRLELEDMKAELLRVAALPWKPNMNDGAILTASPLWKLFRLPKWQKDLKTCWEELERGDYDWAHMASAVRPNDVQKACEGDRSIAIAHGLEHLCKVEAPKAKKKRGKSTIPEEVDQAK